MATPNTGKNIGRVSIKVLPDTKDFRLRLERDLKRVNDKGWAIKFDKADVDRQKIRADLERQLNSLGMARVRVNVVPHVNSVKLNKNQVRRNIQEQLKDIPFAIDVHPQLKGVQAFKAQVHRLLSGTETVNVKVKTQDAKIRPEIDRAALEKVRNELYALFGDDKNGKRVLEFATHLNEEAKLKLEHDVNALIRKYNGKELGLNLALNMLLARTRLAAFMRDRVLTVFVRISKASLAKAAKELATLAASASGIRLLGDWIENVTDAFRNLDRNAPMIIGITSLVASVISGVVAAGQGIIGIAGDVAKIGPALLVLPGLILNAIASFAVIGIAMKDAKTELSSLADDMTELGDIISETFWDKARDPIVNMTNTLMPQLRNAMRDTADATGGFIGEMAAAFERHLGNGRLEKIFDGINESWDILAEGADGFAGAIVNLSEIGARYMPGLAQWFSDLAGDFDAWLTKISTSDQLETWISNAVDEMEELWRATENAWGFLTNLYDAANKAGGTGLTGLADVLGAWDEITSTKEFQDGLVAIFKGSSDAMDAFAEAIKAVGRLIGDNADAFEDLLASAGGFAGGLIEAIADALNSPRVIGGMNDFSEGLIRGLEKIRPELQPLADVFGSFISLLGTVAESTLPSVVTALGNLTPALDAIIKPIQDALPRLGDALVKITDALGPAAERIAGALSQSALSVISSLADALEALAPTLSVLAENVLAPVADLIAALAEAANKITGALVPGTGTLESFKDGQGRYAGFTENGTWLGLKINQNDLKDQILEVTGQDFTLSMVTDTMELLESILPDQDAVNTALQGLFNPGSKKVFEDAAKAIGSEFGKSWKDVLATEGEAGAASILSGLAASNLPNEVKGYMADALAIAGYDAGPLKEFGHELSSDIVGGVEDGFDSHVKSGTGGMLRPYIDQLADAFATGGSDAASELWNSFDEAVRGNQDYIFGMLEAMGYDISDLLGEGGAKAASAFGDNMGANIKPALNGVGATALNSVEQAFAGVQLATGESGLAAAAALGEGLSSGTPGVQQAITALKQAGLVDPMADLQSLMAVPGGDAVLGLIAGLQSGTVGVAGASGQLRQAGIVDQFNMLSAVMPGVGADTIVGLIDGINSQSGALAGASGAVKQSGISDQFKAMSSLLPNAGAETILGLIQGLESKGISVGTTAESIKQSGILDKFVGANGFLTAEGRAIVDGLSSGITSGKSGLGLTTDGVKQEGIVAKFNGAGRMLLGPGGEIIKGLSSGITSQKSATGSAVDDVKQGGILDKFLNPGRILSDQGDRLTRGLANSIRGAKHLVTGASADLRAGGVMTPFAGIDTRFGEIGSSIPSRLAIALRNGTGNVSGAAGSLRANGFIAPFTGIGTRFGEIGATVPDRLAGALRNGQRSVATAAQGLRADGVVGQFTGIDQRFTDIGGGIGNRLSAALYASAGAVSRAAGQLRSTSVVRNFAGIDRTFYGIGYATATQLAVGISYGYGTVSAASASLRDRASSNLSSLTGTASSIGYGVYASITYWVNQSIGQLDRLASAARNARTTASGAISVSPYSSSSTMSLRSIADGISAQSTLMATSAASTASYVPPTLPSEAVYGRTQEPANVQVTMPLLPGETPAEQRDNVVRELRGVFGN